MTPIAAYVASLVVIGVLDFIWLAFIARDFYRGEIGHLMADTVNMPAAIAFYLLYPIGVFIFAVQPSIGSGWSKAAMMGALFGLFAYATYDLSNLATLKGWSWKMALVDMAWGTVLTATTAAVAVIVAERMQS